LAAFFYMRKLANKEKAKQKKAAKRAKAAKLKEELIQKKQQGIQDGVDDVAVPAALAPAAMAIPSDVASDAACAGAGAASAAGACVGFLVVATAVAAVASKGGKGAAGGAPKVKATGAKRAANGRATTSGPAQAQMVDEPQLQQPGGVMKRPRMSGVAVVNGSSEFMLPVQNQQQQHGQMLLPPPQQPQRFARTTSTQAAKRAANMRQKFEFIGDYAFNSPLPQAAAAAAAQAAAARGTGSAGTGGSGGAAMATSAGGEATWSPVGPVRRRILGSGVNSVDVSPALLRSVGPRGAARVRAGAMYSPAFSPSLASPADNMLLPGNDSEDTPLFLPSATPTKSRPFVNTPESVSKNLFSAMQSSRLHRHNHHHHHHPGTSSLPASARKFPQSASRSPGIEMLADAASLMFPSPAPTHSPAVGGGAGMMNAPSSAASSSMRMPMGTPHLMGGMGQLSMSPMMDDFLI
jgi:hypothetical protein